MEVVDAIRALGGSALWSELSGNVARRALRRAVDDGRVVRNGAAYCVPTSPRAWQLAVGLRATRSHATAAEHWGWALPPEDRPVVQLTVPSNASRKRVPDDVVLHFRDLDGAVDRVTGPVQTVVDCLRDETLRVALSVGDSALRDGSVTLAEVVGAVAAVRGPGSRVARRRAPLLDARAANAFESCARAVLLEAGITGFEPQVVIRHRGQFVGRVDLADRVRCIVIECDGFETHGTLPAMTADCARHTLLAAAGWRTLRFTWYQVMFHPEWVLERVQDTIEVVERAQIEERSRGRRRSRAS